jgi:hypothetical protein
MEKHKFHAAEARACENEREGMHMSYRFVLAITTAFICALALSCGSPPPGTTQAPTPTATQAPTTTQSTTSAAPSPFELSGYKVEWLSHKIPTDLEPAKEYHFPVTFKNAGDTKWTAKGGGGSVINQVFISYHWLPETGDKPVHFEGHRTPLPNDVAPGETVSASEVLVVSPDIGSYRLQITLVQEGVAWFEQQGAKTLIVPVKVH